MRFLYMGTAEFACPTLQALVASEHEALAGGDPAGPAARPWPPIGYHAREASALLELELPILQPPRLRRGTVVDELAAFSNPM